ncbi:MAG: peptidoglycan D,D-transpeptidase FtsI family protein [Phycisphaerales bacterium]
MKTGLTRRIDGVTRLGAAAVTLLLVVMLGRVAQLQFRPPDRLDADARSRQTRRAVPAVRGSILDRRGRLLAATEFGTRVFVDPTEFPAEPDEAIARLADAIGAPAEEIGAALIPKLEENERRRRAAARSATRSAAGPSIAPGTALVQRIATQTATEDGGSAIAGPGDAEPATPSGALIRYARVSGVLPDATIAVVRSLKVAGVHTEQVPLRRYPAGGLAASIVGKVGFDDRGLLGAEFAGQEGLSGEPGRIAYTRDARGRPLWMHPESYERAKAGEDLWLSIDAELQRMCEEELTRGVHEADAAGGRLILLDAPTGDVLAMVDMIRPLPGLAEFPFAGADGRWTPPAPGTRFRVLRPDPARDTHPALGRARCVEDAYEPGSAFKPFVWSAVLDLGKVRTDEVFNTAGGKWYTKRGREIEDVTVRPSMTWAEVLLNSSNIGMVKGADRLTHAQLRDAILRFGFGRATGVGLPGESPGLVTRSRDWTHLTQESVAFGAEVAVTPLQMVRAFSVFARTGAAAGTLPPVRLVSPSRGDRAADPALTFIHRVITPGTGAIVREILSETARKMEALMVVKDRTATGWRYPIFGKSGTATIALGKPPPGKRRPPGIKGYFDRQYLSSFLAAGPVQEPRLVIIVIIDDPGPDSIRRNEYYGSHVAGPVVRRVMERALAYMGVPPSPPSEAPARIARGAGD